MDKFIALILPQNNGPRGMALLGDDGVGKTATIREFTNRIGKDCVFLSAKGLRDIRSLFSEIYRTMTAITTFFNNIEELKTSVFNAIDKFKPKIIFIDDIDDFLLQTNIDDSNSNLKALVNIMEIKNSAIGLIGSLQVENIIRSQPAYFKISKFEPFKNDREFRNFISRYERDLPLKKPSCLNKEPLANKIYQLSKGYIGRIADILKNTAIAALMDGTERITLKHLEDWEKGKRYL